MGQVGGRPAGGAPAGELRTALARRTLPHMRILTLIALALLFAGSAIYFIVARPDPAAFAAWGYPGIAVLMFLCSTTIVLPMPGFAAVVAAGGVWNPLLVGVSAGIGGGLGEFSSYLLGLGGETLVGLEDNRRWQAVSAVVQRYGFWAIVLAAATPLPFDLVGIIAGSTGYSALRFVAASLLGKIIKYLLLAYFGDAAFALWQGLA